MGAGAPGRLLAMAPFCAGGVACGQSVKITPPGSHAGELCDRDRATIFEDPTGVPILYDAGHSVRGAGDTGIHAEMKSIVSEDATADGALRPTARTAAFVDLVEGRPVHLARSGGTLEFDGRAKCVAGC